MKIYNHFLEDLNMYFNTIEGYQIDEEAFGKLNRTYSNTEPMYFDTKNILVYANSKYYMIDKKDFFDFRTENFGNIFLKFNLVKFTSLYEAMKFMRNTCDEINSIEMQMHYDSDGYLHPSFIVSTYQNNN
jgi:hypothetical protein